MKYARIDSNNVVVETFVPPAGVSISECFTPEIVSMFLECPENIEVHSLYQNNEWVYVEVPLCEPPSQEEPRSEPASIPTTQV